MLYCTFTLCVRVYGCVCTVYEKSFKKAHLSSVTPPLVHQSGGKSRSVTVSLVHAMGRSLFSSPAETTDAVGGKRAGCSDLYFHLSAKEASKALEGVERERTQTAILIALSSPGPVGIRVVAL